MAAGITSPTLPKMAAYCERSRYTISSTKFSTASGVVTFLRRAAMAGAVIAGCLVATVQCASMMMTNDTA